MSPLIETENAVVEGVITSADNGSPLSGATVTVGEHVATTDANGTYRIEGVPSGGTTITAKRPYFSGASATLNVKPGSRVIFSPSLVYSWQAPRISGTVTDSVTGAYLPGAQISLSGANEETITSNGSFLIAELNTGVTQIEATLPGYLPASTEIDAQPGATYNFHPKLVTESSESISVQGIVINMETQQPVPGALIDLAGNNVATVQADSLGRFIASNLLPGETFITVRAPNFDAVSGVIVLSFGENLFLTLEAPPSLYELPSANVTGRVLVVGTDIPVPGAVVRVLQNDVERVAVADSRGVFKLVDVTTGVWEGSVDQLNYGRAPLTFQMPRDAADIDAGAIYLTENIKLPDLVILAIDRSTIYTDPSSFLASGSLVVALKNIGQKETLSGFRVIVYEDRDANMSYNETVDRIVGSSRSEALVQPGENGQMAISIDGQLQFRDAPLRVKLDGESEVTELLEDNNDAGSCELAKCGE